MQLTKEDASLLVEVLYWNCLNYQDKFSVDPRIREMQEEKLRQMKELKGRISQHV